MLNSYRAIVALHRMRAEKIGRRMGRRARLLPADDAGRLRAEVLGEAKGEIVALGFDPIDEETLYAATAAAFDSALTGS